MKRGSFLKTNSTLKRGNGFKKSSSSLKKSSFKRTPSDLQLRIKEADSKFSKFIIIRDGKCLKCGSTQMLSCSHFHGRANFSTRFEPLNCVAFCIPCHDFMESKKKEGKEYFIFMEELLGIENFGVLNHIAKLKMSPNESLVLANNLLKNVETNNEIQY